MKKKIAFLLAALMLLTLLAGCQSANEKKPDKGNSNGLNSGNEWNLKGAEAAKLLLAEQRLNARLLKNEGNIFATGPEVFYNLAAIAEANLYRYTYADADAALTALSSDGAYPVVAPLGNAQKSPELTAVASQTVNTDGSVLEIDGNTYTWSKFAEYSNSYDYFENLTGNIVHNANRAAELIDYVKRYVRVVDKWVDAGGTQYYLHVEDNCEILFRRHDDFVEICKRFRNEQGLNVYEIYFTSDLAETRMTYIPGRLCEYTHRQASYGFTHNIIAENTKGYWEFLDVGGTAPHYNVSCIVVKDDICYDAPYGLADIARGSGSIRIISPDKASDIMDCGDLTEDRSWTVNLSLQAFEGVEAIRIEVDPDRVAAEQDRKEGDELLTLDEYGKTFYLPTGEKSPEVVLTNGMVLKRDEVYLDGRVSIGYTHVSYHNKQNGTYGYSASVMIFIEADTAEERIQTLKDFLSLTGLSCKWSMEYVILGTQQAFKEIEQSQQYQQWNESPIRTSADIARGFANLDSKYKAWTALYDTVKDAPVIDLSNEQEMALNIHFAPIAAQSATEVKSEGLSVSVSGLTLSVTDMTLFVEGDVYMVNFALLAQAGGGLVHIPVEGTQTVTYDGGRELTVPQTATFTIPVLMPDEYTVVTYISTPEGIRMSEYTALAFHTVTPYEGKEVNVAIETALGNAKEMKVTCSYITNIEVALALGDEEVSYEQMYRALAEAAYTFGFADEEAKLENLDGENEWRALTGEETALAAGTYRLKYQIRNGDSLAEGYVFVQYEK